MPHVSWDNKNSKIRTNVGILGERNIIRYCFYAKLQSSVGLSDFCQSNWIKLNLISNTESCIYLHPELCNLILIFVYMCIYFISVFICNVFFLMIRFLQVSSTLSIQSKFHYCCSSMLRLSEKHRFFKISSFWEAMCSLIGQLSSVLWLAKYLKGVTEMLRPLPCCDGAMRLKQ